MIDVYLWLKELRKTSRKVNSIFCFNRYDKLEELGQLIRLGSVHVEHALISEDLRDLLVKELEEASKIYSKWYV